MLPLSLIGILAIAGGVREPIPQLEKHNLKLRQITTIYAKTASFRQDATTREWKKVSAVEAWKSGVREREIDTAFEIVGPGGVTQYPDGETTETSLSDREVRTVRGRNAEQPTSGLLDLLTHADARSKVQCTLTERQPGYGGVVMWSCLCLEPAPGQPLRLVARTSEITRVPSELPGMVRLRIKASPTEYMVGGLIDLDAQHGFMIRRVEWPGLAVHEVKSFQEVSKGIWIPTRVHTSTPGGETHRLDVIECKVNLPIADEQLEVKYPEGAGVRDYTQDTPRIHFWGKDGPVKTFSRYREFEAYAKEMERRAEADRQAAAPRQAWIMPLVWGTVALTTIVGVLVFVRKRLRRRERALS